MRVVTRHRTRVDRAPHERLEQPAAGLPRMSNKAIEGVAD